MTRLAAILVVGAMAATPAAAACSSVPEIVAQLRAPLPARAFVGEVPASSVPTVLAWLESEGLPHRADRIVQVAGDRGIGLVLVAPDTDWACDGVKAIELVGQRAVDLVETVRRFQELTGRGKEREA